MPRGPRVLELGCGAGLDAEAMTALGADVTATDGSPTMARIAEHRLGRPVRVMLFDDLDDEAVYDGVWANASLLHARADALPGVLARVWRALKPGGLFYASFKSGEGEGRDRLDRYYSFLPEPALRAAYGEAGAWATLTLSERAGGGFDGVARIWFECWAVKATTAC